MKRTSSSNPRRRLLLSLLALSAFALLLAAPFAIPYAAQAQKNLPRERIATGKVVNKDGDPLGGAIVFLKNSRSNAVKSYIADENGSFRFGDLAQDTDYELWAESNSVRSKSRQISSFDNESKFYFVFKVNIAKPASLDGPAI